MVQKNSGGLSQKMPVLFLGHGSPLNAIENNEFEKGWVKIASELPRPRAVLCVSAHWYTEKTSVTNIKAPGTIHDFYGFPEELNILEYNAPGAPELAKQIKEILQSVKTGLDNTRGLDHGTWVVLRRMYPKADIPVVQLAIDSTLSPKRQFELGRELAVLRKKGVLIIGSGNVVHNLMLMDMDSGPFSWAVEFDSFVKQSLVNGDTRALINIEKNRDFSRAHPTTEHYPPLLYALGAAEGEKPYFSVEKIFAGSLSMRCVVWK